MGSNYSHYCMLGIDISDKKERIKQLEEELNQKDGLEGFSLNYRNVKIGYNERRSGDDNYRNFFGIILDEAEEFGNDFSKSYRLHELINLDISIRDRYTEFLEKYFPDEIKDNRPMHIRFFSTWC